jgi:hypothetical protein
MDISESIEHAVGNYFTEWMTSHSYLAWIVSNPLLSLSLLLLSLFCLWGLLKAIGRGFEQLWLLILTTPLKLLQPTFRQLGRAINSGIGYTNSRKSQLDPKLTAITPATKIERIIDRLNLLNREQQNLLRELAILTDSEITDLDHRSDPQYQDSSAKLPKLNR